MESAAVSEVVAAADSLAQRPLKATSARGRRWIVLGVLFLVGLLGGIFGPKVFDRLFIDSDSLRLPWSIVWLVAAYLLAVFVHELGHVAAALLVGWRVHAIAVMPVMLRLKPLRALRAPPTMSGDIGGFVLAVPPHAELKLRDIAFYAGGVTANAIAWWLSRGYAIENFGTAAGDMAGMFAALNAVMACVNLVPFRFANGGASDGRWIADAVSARSAAGHSVARLSTMAVAGLRPREWPGVLVEGLSSQHVQQDQRALASLLLAAHCVDTGRATAAGAAMVAALNVEPANEPTRAAYLLTAAWLVARDGHADAAKHVLSLLPDGVPVDAHLSQRVQALVSLAEGQWSIALQNIADCRRAARSSLATLGPDDIEEIDAIEARARAGLWKEADMVLRPPMASAS